MALVGYSDSESSDNEDSTPQQATSTGRKPPNDASGNAKPAFQKVVNRSNPRKIRVDLFANQPSSKHKDNEAPNDLAEDEPPAKKTKTSGGIGDLNSFLPAPKNPGKPAVGNTSESVTPKVGTGGLRKSVSLKTGSGPSFVRGHQDLTEPNEYGIGGSVAAPEDSNAMEGVEMTLEPKKEEVQLTGKPMMFKPLSVARAAQGKKKKKPGMGGVPSSSAVSSKSIETTTPKIGSAATPADSKPKKSLFSTYSDDAIPGGVSGGYDQEVEIDIPNHHPETYPPDPLNANAAASSIHTHPPSTTTQPSDLDSIANNLNLSAAERRQLFGRNGAAAPNAKVAQFSLASEYSHNRHVAENEGNAVAAHNPVRSIAPGKHSLQQLVTAAQSQKDALEQSWSQGKANRKEAGNRYGWS